MTDTPTVPSALTPTASLDVGSPAPAFSVATNGGGHLSSADLAGKIVVIYFYPKDATPGCTTEAQNFRDLHDDFTRAGAVVIGVSKDSVKSHDNFIAKQELPFTLASDSDGAMVEAFGVWVEKMNYGKKYMGIERSTFVIGKDGAIAHIWRKVKVAGHAAAVLKAVQSLLQLPL